MKRWAFIVGLFAVIGTEAFSATRTESTDIVMGSPEVGRITWSSGELVFKGKAKPSAKIFFDLYLRRAVDEYIKTLLEKKQGPLRGPRR